MSDAEKEFYKIRQRYGKERRKMVMSLKGKSGQDAQSTYTPTRELYNLLVCDSFLHQAVVSRKTSSNYIKKMDEPASNYSPKFKMVVPINVIKHHFSLPLIVSPQKYYSRQHRKHSYDLKYNLKKVRNQMLYKKFVR